MRGYLSRRQGVQELGPAGEVCVDVLVVRGHRNDRTGSDDRLPDAAVREPDPDQPGEQLVPGRPRLAGVSWRSRSEDVAAPRSEMVDVPGKTHTLDGGAHPLGELGAQALRARIRLG